MHESFLKKKQKYFQDNYNNIIKNKCFDKVIIRIGIRNLENLEIYLFGGNCVFQFFET